MRAIRQFVWISVMVVCVCGLAAPAAAEGWQASAGFNDKRVSSGGDSPSEWYPGFTLQVERDVTMMNNWNITGGVNFIFGKHSDSETIPGGTGPTSITADFSDTLTYYLGTVRATQNSMGFAPFAQLGVGIARWSFSSTIGGNTTGSDSESAFAFDLQAGLCKSVSERLHAFGGVGYAHASFSEESANAIRINLGLRYMF